jgi:hypothetical protein
MVARPRKIEDKAAICIMTKAAEISGESREDRGVEIRRGLQAFISPRA